MRGGWSVGLIGLTATAFAAGCFKDPEAGPPPTKGAAENLLPDRGPMTGVCAVSIWVVDSGLGVLAGSPCAASRCTFGSPPGRAA